MPKIVINEYDLTKAGTGEYANFSVLLPGLLGAGKKLEDLQNDGIFDENGIYECSSQTDFVANVGKTVGDVTATVISRPAQAPKIAVKVMLAEDAKDNTKDLIGKPAYVASMDGNTGSIVFNSREAFINCLQKMYGGYKPLVAEDATATPEYCQNSAGEYVDEYGNKLDCQDPADTTNFKGVPKPVYKHEHEGETSSGFGIYTAKPNLTGSVGILKDLGNVYEETPYDKVLSFALLEGKKASDDNKVKLDENGYLVVPENTYRASLISSDTTFYIIMDGASNIGSEAETGKAKIKHFGNQIAYELLGLGYTILYKAIDETDDIGDLSFWEPLKDKSTYDFRYVLTGLTKENNAANAAIISLCEWKNTTLDDADVLKDGRGDCFALVDLSTSCYENKTQTGAIPLLAAEANKFASAYAACFAPTVTYTMVKDPLYNNNTTFPASFHYLACAANSANNNYNEWYANAGYTRGIAKYTIESTGCKLGDMAVQALQPRFLSVAGITDGTKVTTNVSVNLIIKIKNSYYLWGNRTAKKLGTRGASDGDLVAQHFLNIRQLCTTIKKQVYVTCRRLTYDPNSNNLWINFRALLTPMLEKMKADQGIRDYEFVKDATDRKALLKASIRIVPIEAVEDFEIGLYLEDSLTEASVSEA